MNKNDFKKLILEAVRDGDGDAYSVSIAEAIEKKTGKRISTGSLFALLGEMKYENLIASERRPGGEQRAFRDKTCYRLTGHGLAEIGDGKKSALSESEIQTILQNATAEVERRTIAGEIIEFELDLAHVVKLIAQLQIGFRHPGNVGQTRLRAEKFVRGLIEEIDPERGDLYKLLMLGFDPAGDN